ncbi:hypothetical protein F4V43_11915 [Paenibacillus spiritus]|uniref:Uncharacterized protein n=1 Tax=Paenibacillus spiritus TaxID=2496557 RepID=A0A5J5G921_9BACL|nr:MULTISPECIES: hypothetical protein [Paenibacillus]KAA9004102.1 hypothetical protein F4V43_11915 [Paenibacillus spiritus]
MKNRTKSSYIAVLTAALLLTVPIVSGASAASPGTAPAGKVAAAKLQAPLPLKHGSGIYNGLADGHTVEIDVYGEATSFQFSDELKAAAASLEEGETVDYVYTERRLAGRPEVRLLTLAAIKVRSLDGDGDAPVH